MWNLSLAFHLTFPFKFLFMPLPPSFAGRRLFLFSCLPREALRTYHKGDSNARDQDLKAWVLSLVISTAIGSQLPGIQPLKMVWCLVFPVLPQGLLFSTSLPDEDN